MRIARWVPKATNTNSQCAIHIVFPLQQWLHERASTLRFTIYKEKSNKMKQYIKILLFHIYMKLNMFRATHRPSSGA